MRNNLLFFICILLFTACEKQAEIPPFETKWVINSLLAQDVTFNVVLQTNDRIDDAYINVPNNWIDPFLNNAKVLIYSENKLVDALEFCNEYGIEEEAIYGRRFNFKGTKKPKVGVEYEIRVASDDVALATAKTIIPQIVPVKMLDTIMRYEKDRMEEFVRGLVIETSIQFLDDAVTEDFYAVLLEIETHYYDSITETHNIIKHHSDIDCNDPVIEDEMALYKIFSDKLINGQKYNLRFSIKDIAMGYPFWGGPNPLSYQYKKVVKVKLLHLTPGLYHYFTDLRLFSNAYENPLVSEPVGVYSNVTNGYGVFECAAASTDSLVFLIDKQGNITNL